MAGKFASHCIFWVNIHISKSHFFFTDEFMLNLTLIILIILFNDTQVNFFNGNFTISLMETLLMDINYC